MGVEERLLLDRVTLHSGNVAVGNEERATVVKTNLADTGLSLGNRAAVTAGIAADAIAIQLFPQSRVAFADVIVGHQDVTQRGHNFILRRLKANSLPSGHRGIAAISCSLACGLGGARSE